MKTEKFDDAINRKINSINPQYTDADIDKAHNFVKANTRIPFIQSIYGKAAISILGATVVGLTIWNVVQMNKQQELSETIQTLKNNIEQPIAKPDTIYIKENAEASPSSNNIASNFNNTIPPQNNIYNTDDKKSTPINPSTTLRVTKNSIDKQDKKSSPKKENNIAIDNSSKNIDKKIIQKDTELIVKNNEAPIVSPDTTKEAADTLQPNIRPKKPASKQYIMVGAGLEKGNQPWGFNIVGEYVFNKNISLGLGLKTLLSPDEHYHDPHDFHDRDARRRNFQQEYGNRLPDSNNIQDIHIRSNLWQIPLQVSYRKHLAKTSRILLVSVGTDLDILANQKIDYKHIGPSNSQEEVNFKAQPKIPILNNITGSIGVQQNWRKYSFQLSLYTSKQLITVPFKKEDLIIGVRLRAFYTFSI